MNYYELKVTLNNFSDWHDIFVAYLAEHDFESFVEEPPILKAYIQESAYNGSQLQKLFEQLNKQGAQIQKYDLALLPQQNWNETWESQFEPVYIDEQLRIVAPFHDLAPFDGIEITILPKMSFGTGHHQTTHLICKNMLSLHLGGKTVLDMGSGTGVLAVLAEKLGAKEVLAIEIEEWSAQNILENIALNSCQYIRAIHGGAEYIPESGFDIILANINKNVLLEQMPHYGKACLPSGLLLLSGFFVTDAADLVAAAENEGFKWLKTDQLENWAVLILKKIE
jgi:ribosomal protein L11 methyltransferase